MPEQTFQAISEMTYEQALAELESVVQTLERGEGTLEETLTLYARGQALLQHCRRLLTEAELKVERLTAAGTAEFPAAGEVE